MQFSCLHHKPTQDGDLLDPSLDTQRGFCTKWGHRAEKAPVVAVLDGACTGCNPMLPIACIDAPYQVLDAEDCSRQTQPSAQVASQPQ